MNIRFAPKRKLAVAGAVAALAIGLAGWGFWRMAVGVWQRDFVLGELQSKLEGLREDRDRAKDLAVILKRQDKNLDRIGEFFVNRERPVAFIEAVERIAVSSGNAIALDVDEGRNDERHLGFRLTAEGEEDNLLRYVRLLEALPYKLEIGEIIFQRRVSDSSTGRTGGKSSLIISLRVSAR